LVNGSVVIYTIIIVYCPTYIYRRGLLTNRLNFSIILNLVSEPSAIKTLLPSPYGICYCCHLLPPPNRRCSLAGQSLIKYCRWFFLPPAAALTCRAKSWFLLPCLCRPSSHHEDNNSFYCCDIQHSSSGLIEAYEHQLSLLANANEAVSSWSRCFPLY